MNRQPKIAKIASVWHRFQPTTHTYTQYISRQKVGKTEQGGQCSIRRNDLSQNCSAEPASHFPCSVLFSMEHNSSQSQSTTRVFPQYSNGSLANKRLSKETYWPANQADANKMTIKECSIINHLRPRTQPCLPHHNTTPNCPSNSQSFTHSHQFASMPSWINAYS